MGLVIGAAALQALLYLLFRVFENRRIPLMPGIAVNYVVAMILGLLYAPPWQAGDLSPLWLPSLGIGALFVVVFSLTGLTTQRSGVAASTVASKMSVVLTVLFAVVVHHERPDLFAWLGLAVAMVSVVLVASSAGREEQRTRWRLPLALFVGVACIDITINAVQRFVLTPQLEAVFPTLGLGFAGVFAMVHVLSGKDRKALASPSVWLWGGLLGLANYATLLFVVKALAHSGMAASTVFPLVSIFVILFGTAGSVFLFQEKVTTMQRIGIGCAVLALGLLMVAGT
ncbi:MAG: EamA family transporter [Flavobacteriales bacterium]|nr:EamA family transporter [Flavobacteriales bacterium]MBP6642239.1 EamA family transporter [Flavobacteriales bacterium]MBP7154789.1 EamA family transporter [Flavobacteriales bacterium]HQV74002.1 EamA family transporter [Flavobacteriales bacterium]